MKYAGSNYSRTELLEEITSPSMRIKPSMKATRITRQNGEVLLGRIVESSDETIAVIGIGNVITRVARRDIRSTHDVEESMMWTGLLDGLSEDQVGDLLDYLSALSTE
ncbi:MAG: hypothetical protein R2832_09900 [Rhodothermales bacterium]